MSAPTREAIEEALYICEAPLDELTQAQRMEDMGQIVAVLIEAAHAFLLTDDPYSRLRGYESSLGYLIEYAKPIDHEYMACYEPEVNAGPCQLCAIASVLESVQAVLKGENDNA